MHAVVDAAELVQREQQPRAERAGAHRQRVEQPHLDIRRGRQDAQQLVFAGGVQVVDQQAHPHAAQRGVAQLTQELLAGVVVLDQVVLASSDFSARRASATRASNAWPASGSRRKPESDPWSAGVAAATMRASRVSPTSVIACEDGRGVGAGNTAQPLASNTVANSASAATRFFSGSMRANRRPAFRSALHSTFGREEARARWGSSLLQHATAHGFGTAAKP